MHELAYILLLLIYM